MNNMSQGLCMVDKEQRLRVCNARFLSLFDLTAEAASPGRPISDILGASPHISDKLQAISHAHQSLVLEGKAGNYVLEIGHGLTLGACLSKALDAAAVG